MKQSAWKIIILLLICICSIQGVALANAGSGTNRLLDPARTWIVLMEKNHFPFGYSSLDVDFINTTRMKDTFTKLGVPESQIQIKKDNMKRSDVEKSITWLKGNSKPGDTLVFFIATHGNWLGNELKWNLWFHDLWKGLQDRQRVLIVDSCQSGKYISPLWTDTNGIALSVSGSTELAWWGILEEGLPIIGDVWLYYFVNAIFDPAADHNADGMISVEEAFTAALPLTQKYYKEQVFAVKEFAASFRNAGMNIDRPYPIPDMYDTLEGELVLYILPKE